MNGSSSAPAHQTSPGCSALLYDTTSFDKHIRVLEVKNVYQSYYNSQLYVCCCFFVMLVGFLVTILRQLALKGSNFII